MSAKAATATRFLERFGKAASPGFDPDRDLQRIGLANQTTMLMSESLRVQELFRQAMRDRYGDAGLAERFRAFDTICSATQDRQDAVVNLLKDTSLDLMIVIGGYNSSNTVQSGAHLRRAGADLPHRGPGLPGIGRRHPPSSGGRPRGGSNRRVASPHRAPCPLG